MSNAHPTPLFSIIYYPIHSLLPPFSFSLYCAWCDKNEFLELKDEKEDERNESERNRDDCGINDVDSDKRGEWIILPGNSP